jgi:hypothetical protein
VGTAMKITSDPATASAVELVKARRPASTLRRTMSSSPGSKIGIPPAFSIDTFSGLLSAQIT